MAPNSKVNARRKAKREGTKGPKDTIRQSKVDDTVENSSAIPLELQQLLLNIFRHSFVERLTSDIEPLLQEVKGHLYNRDFATAFGKNEYLEAYAARWSPSRALGYAELFCDLKEHLIPEPTESNTAEDVTQPWKVICLGGGAGAEVVALGGLQKLLSDQIQGSDESPVRKIEATALDIADWNKVVESLTTHLITPPPLSKYASAAAKENNVALLPPESIDVKFIQHDVLKPHPEDVASRLSDAHLVTLMFTLNELYTMSISSTQRFLLDLTRRMAPGSILLVVDSPGSYSSVTLNGTEKKYPMHWLLDHTLLKQASQSATEEQQEKEQENQGRSGKRKEAEPVWEKVLEDESRWFRVDDDLSYPIAVENMRMQVHVYKRL